MTERVFVSLPDTDNEYQILQAADAVATGAKLGLEIVVAHAKGGAVEQIQQLFKAINGDPKPRVIVMEPVAIDGMERVAQKAVSAGIGWCVLNSAAAYLAALRERNPTLPVFATGSDQAEIGRIQGRQVRRLLPGGGTVLYLQGPSNATAAVDRARGLQEAIAGSGISPILLDAQWSEESAEKAVRGWLRLKGDAVRVDLVAAQDDAMARGARRAVEAHTQLRERVGEIPFLGIDGVPTVGQQLVRTGQLTATVIMPSNTGPALDALGAWLRSGKAPPAEVAVPVHSFPPEDQLRPRGPGAPAAP